MESVEKVWHMPPEPDQEMPFILINFHHFPTEELAKAYEDTARLWWPELILFVGRMSGDLSEKYTHCTIWQYKNFDEYKRNIEDYAVALEQMDDPQGDWPGYMWDHVYACRVADLRDPVYQEHGIDEWTRRLHESWGNPDVPNPKRVAEWKASLWQKLVNDYGPEAPTRSGFVPPTGPNSMEGPAKILEGADD